MKGYVTIRLLIFLNELDGRLSYSLSKIKIHIVLHSYHIFTPKLALCLVFYHIKAIVSQVQIPRVLITMGTVNS